MTWQHCLDTLRDGPDDEREPYARISNSPSKAIAYCRKEETRFGLSYEAGDLNFAQGKASRYTEAVHLITTGASMYDIALEYPEQLVLHERGFQSLRSILLKHSQTIREDLEVLVLYGRAGAGKTYAVHSIFPDSHIVSNMQDGQPWYDGYDGDRVLIIDEFSGWMRYSSLLRVLDIYPLPLPVKHGFTTAGYTKIVITSNLHPSQWYTMFGGNIPEPLLRRIRRVLHCTYATSREDISAFLRGDIGPLQHPLSPRLDCACCARTPVATATSPNWNDSFDRTLWQ